jgi:hypothetical protein
LFGLFVSNSVVAITVGVVLLTGSANLLPTLFAG